MKMVKTSKDNMNTIQFEEKNWKKELIFLNNLSFDAKWCNSLLHYMHHFGSTLEVWCFHVNWEGCSGIIGLELMFGGVKWNFEWR